VDNGTEIDDLNQPNKPGKRPAPNDTLWLFQFGNGPAQRVYSFRIYLIGTS